jgi:hypothetical protein
MGIPIPVITLAPAASPVADITAVDITAADIITGAVEGITARDFMPVMSPVRMARPTRQESTAAPSGKSWLIPTKGTKLSKEMFSRREFSHNSIRNYPFETSRSSLLKLHNVKKDQGAATEFLIVDTPPSLESKEVRETVQRTSLHLIVLELDL